MFGQFDVWKKDARDFAAYEEYLFRRCEELCAVIEVLQDYEQAQANIRADEAQAQSLSQAQVFQQSQGIVSSPLIAASRPSKKAIKRASAQTGTFPLGVASPAVPSSFSKALPTTSANPSPQLRSLQQEYIRYNSAYIAWLTDTSTPSHIVFNSGLGAIGAPTKASLTTYIDGLLDASDIQALTHGAASFVAAAIRTSVDAVLTSAKEKIQSAKLIGSSMVTTSSSSAGAAGASFSFQAPIMIGSVNLRSLISAKTNAARSQGAFDLAAATIDAIDSVESRLKTLTESDLL